MNERIKELAEQAGLEWKVQPPHYTNTNNPIDFPKSVNSDLEKFAELIVEECAHIAWLYDDPKLYWHGAVIAKSIKHRFGVEE